MSGFRLFPPLSVIFALLLPMISVAAEGSDQRTGELVVVRQDEIHDGWLFASGETVSIEGTVNGDVYAAGGRIQVSGMINGDLIAAGGEIVITGTISDDIRMAGGTLTVDGTVGKDATVTGGNVTVGKGGSIRGNLLAAGGVVSIDGSVGRNARVGAGEMTVEGAVDGDLSFGGGGLALLPGSRVTGDVSLFVDNLEQVSIPDGAVGGSVNWMVDESEDSDTVLGFSPFHLLLKVHWMLALLLLGLILSFLFPETTNRLGSVITGNLWETAVWGLISVLVLPAIAGFLFVTIIGIPLGIILLAFIFFLLYVSHVAVGVAAGRLILRKEDLRGAALFGLVTLGIFGTQLLTFIPLLRYLVIVVTVLIGLGGTLMVLKEMVRPGTQPSSLGDQN